MTEIAHISSLCSKWLQNYRFEVGTGCQSSPACVNAHRLSQNIHFCPLSQCKIKEKKKIPECQQYYRDITYTGFAYSVCHTNYLYFKNPRFLTTAFTFTFQMGPRYLPILEVKSLKYKEWSKFLENYAGSLQQSRDQFHLATSVRGEGDAQICSLWTQLWGFCLFGGVLFVAVFSFPPQGIISRCQAASFLVKNLSLHQGMEKQQAFEMFDCKAQIVFYWDLFQNVNMSSWQAKWSQLFSHSKTHFQKHSAKF